ncbi:hypothetical protein FS837_008302 [Tulasnella sp. UAMH 9824]|nr:hypothetical protein FS837_008302 [Tulasnella sp. UAMH 9824]
MTVKLIMERPARPSSAAENGTAIATTILESRRHYELLPIHQLPSELLYVIIENVYPEVSYKLLYEIRSVCKHWMDLVFKLARNRDSPTGHLADLNDAHSARLLLPRLRSLLIAQVPFVSHARLLDLVEAPNLRRFVVFQSVQDPSYDFAPMFESAGRFVGTSRHSSADDDTSRLNIFGPSRVLAIVVGDRRVILKNDKWTRGSRQEECPAGLSAAFRHFDRRLSENIKVIRLSGSGGAQEIIGLARVLNGHLHNVEELEIISGAHETLSILGWLSSSPTEEMDAWLFPQLISFQFDVLNGVACDGILEVVEARRNVGHVQALGQLTITGGEIRRDTVEELETYWETLKMIGTEVN